MTITVGHLAIAMFIAALACFALVGLALANVVPYAHLVTAFLALLLGVLLILMSAIAWEER